MNLTGNIHTHSLPGTTLVAASDRRAEQCTVGAINQGGRRCYRIMVIRMRA
jgi:hypothetical protein